MDYNINKLMMILATINILAISIFKMFNSEKYLPNILQGVIQYGKFVDKEAQNACKKFQVPKSLFRQFYSFAAPVFTVTLFVVIQKYFFDGKISEIFFTILDLQLGSSRKANVSPEATMLAITLMTIHVWKRFYESHYITIFSKALMSILLYMIGFVHYSVLATTIVGESYGFVRGSYSNFDFNKLINFYNIICSIILLAASYEQLQTNVILTNLRKTKNGKVDSGSYKIPMGRLFNYISTPLQFTEIVIYLTLTAILWESSTIYYIAAWVLTNQIGTGVFQHQWYIKKFEDYPKQRKIIFPFIF